MYSLYQVVQKGSNSVFRLQIYYLDDKCKNTEEISVLIFQTIDPPNTHLFHKH